MTVVFAALVLRRYAVRREPHLLLWGIGLSFFGLATVAETYSAVAWHPVAFRLWYLGGAVLSAAWIGQGTVHLLAGPRRRPLASALTGLLAAASLVASGLVFTVPLDASAFDPRRPLGVQYRAVLPPRAPVRRITPAFNIYGTAALVGGALYSAWLFRRRALAPHRVLGNLLIALGALTIALAGTLVRFGLGGVLALGELLAAALMCAGFLLAAGPAAGRISASPARR
ncbi:MAG: hypothetical protein QN194_07240 [Armatimonadota bacterium]|nr:hypothetical protein [Armatimonadota bacterium]